MNIMVFRDKRYPELPHDTLVLDFNNERDRATLKLHVMFLRDYPDTSLRDDELADQIVKRIKVIERDIKLSPAEKQKAEWRKKNKKYSKQRIKERAEKKKLKEEQKKCE